MKNVELKVVVAPQPEKVLEKAQAQAVESIKSKVAHVKGIKYDAKKIKFVSSKPFTECMSKIYAVKEVVYVADSKYRNNIAYLSDRLDEVSSVEEITEENEKEILAITSDIAKARACFRFFKKKEEGSYNDTLESIETMYPAYVNRIIEPEKWAETLEDYFKVFGMECDKSVVKFFSDFVGARVATTKDWADCLVDNMTPSNFAKLMLALMLQLCVDKAVLSQKIIKSELDGSELVNIDEFAEMICVPRPTYKTTKDEYKAVLEAVGAGVPKANAKKEEWVKAYNKAKKAGLFVEY